MSTRVLNQVAALLRGYGWKVEPPPGPELAPPPVCPHCGHERKLSVAEHARRLGELADVTAIALAGATGCTPETAHTMLSQEVAAGRMQRVSRGRYRAC